MKHNRKSRLTAVIDQKELTEEQITKLAQLINRKIGVIEVKIERNLIGWVPIIH